VIDGFSITDIALARPVGTGYAASHIAPAGPNHCAKRPRWRSLPYAMSDASMPTCLVPELISALRKWPSLNKERVSVSLGARPYMISEGTLEECVQRFMELHETQRHLYEIHTALQSDLVGAILSTENIVELARLRDFHGK
jgi:hypothetical protein